MTKNKGGRPAHHDGEIKKAAIAVRTAPSIRDALRVAADESGRSVTQEVEARLIASFERDAGRRSAETERLLNRFAAEITEIEALTGKAWHRDRRTAGSVMELFEKKASVWLNVDDPHEDEFVDAAWRKLHALREERKRPEAGLARLGIKTDQAKNTRAPKGGLSEIYSDDNEPLNALAHAMAGVTKGRWFERMQLEKLEVEQNVREAALMVIEMIETLDDQIAAAELEYSAAVRPFIMAELEGRELYRSERRKRAAMAVERGEMPDQSDWKFE